MSLDLTFITIGLLFLLGLVADEVGRRTLLPRVTLLLACGVLVGRSGFDLLPIEMEIWYEFFSILALTMVAFLLGGIFEPATLRRHGREIMVISIAIVVTTLVVVSGGLWLIGVAPALALLLGAIATATAPAAVQDVLRQHGRGGSFAVKIKGIVAIDDAWGIIAFSIALVLAAMLTGRTEDDLWLHAVRDLGGGIALGAAIGVPAAFLTGRLRKGEPMQTEALGIVFLTAGTALWLEVSFLVAGITAGAIIVNLARHHDHAFHEIEHIQWPFMILFFILAGASLEIGRLMELGMIGLAFIGLRIASRILGGWVGAGLGHSPGRERPWFGVALMPQAGVAIGMALVAANHFPEMAGTILALTIGTTVVFELLGPPATLMALRRNQH
ncbi:cation:proton antiporter [Thioalkalivibrio sp.]|uniref:cation:proton antiporter n=1 Tax=Thioalkalivibrio sp. TaxID=2093813 RepID=UPI0035625064